MNIENHNLQRVRTLLAELEKLEFALTILTNYDATVSAKFMSHYNCGSKVPVDVVIPVPNEIKNSITNYVITRISDIKKELEKM